MWKEVWENAQIIPTKEGANVRSANGKRAEVGTLNGKAWKNRPENLNEKECKCTTRKQKTQKTNPYFNETSFQSTKTPQKKEQQATFTTKWRRRKRAEV